MTMLSIRRRGILLRYGLAVVTILAVAGLRWMLTPVLDERSPYTLFLMVLPLLAWYTGRNAATVALLIGAVIGTVWFIPNIKSFESDVADALALLIYAIIGYGSVFLADKLAELYQRLTLRTTQLEQEIQRRQVLETALRTKERLTMEQLGELEAIYQNSPVGLCILDIEGHFLRVNRKVAELSGRPMQDLVGQKIFDIFRKADYPLEAIFDQIKATGEPVFNMQSVGKPINQPNYTQYTIAHWIPLKDATGELVGISGVIEDITHLKDIENSLRESETRLRLALKISPLNIAHSDLNLRYTWAFTTDLIDETAVIGKRDDEILPKALAETILQLKQQAIETRAAVQTEADSQEVPIPGSFHITAEPSFDEHQQVDGVYTTALDITAHKIAERRTRTLYEIAAALTAVTTLPEIAEVVLTRAFQMLGESQTSGLRLLSADGKVLTFVGAKGLDQEASSYYNTIPLEARHPAAEAIRLRKPVWIEGLTDYQQRYPDMFKDEAPVIGVHSAFCIPMVLNGRALGTVAGGFLYDRPFSADEREYCMVVAQLCAQAVDRVYLTEKSREAAAVEERQRLARDLHDSVNQALFAATSIAEGIPRVWAEDPARAMKLLETVIVTNRAAMAEMRTLLIELRPEALLRSQLPELLSYLVDSAKGRTTIEADLQTTIEEGATKLPPEVHIALYRIAQEAIHNLLKHSHATRFTVDLKHHADWVSLKIGDNGKGFDTKVLSSGLGVGSMRERATHIQADFELTSSEGRGTTVHVHWTHHPAGVAG